MMKLFNGYWVFLATFILNFVSIGVFNSSSLYLDPLKETFPGANSATIAFFSTIQVVVGLVASMGGGPVQDWLSDHGMNMQMQFVVFGGGFMCLGFVWSSFCDSIPMLLVGASIIGIGVGMGGFVSSGICVLWFDKNRGTMLLLSMSGRGLGSIAGSMATSHLIDSFMQMGFEDPWRPCMQVVGVASLAIGTVASVAMRLPLPGEVEEHESEAGEATELKVEAVISSPANGKETQSYGAATVKDEESKGTNGDSAKPMKRPRLSTHHSVAAFASTRQSRRSLLSSVAALDSLLDAGTQKVGKKESVQIPRRRTSMAEFDALSCAPVDFTGDSDDSDFPDFLKSDMQKIGFNEILWSKTSVCLNIWSIITSFSFLNLQVYLPAYASSIGLPSGVAGTALSIFGFGLLIANLTLGPITDRMGSKMMLIVSMMGLAAMDFLWPSRQNSLGLDAVAGLYGFFSSTNGCLPLIIIADAFSDAPSNHILMLNGILNITKCAGFLFGPAIAAFLMRSPADYQSVATFSWVSMVAGNLFLFAIPRPKNEDLVEKDTVKTNELQPLLE